MVWAAVVHRFVTRNSFADRFVSCRLVVSFFTMFVGLGMAEIVSAIPSAGGPYFWAAILAPKKWAPFASWVTGMILFDCNPGRCFLMLRNRLVQSFGTGRSDNGHYIWWCWADLDTCNNPWLRTIRGQDVGHIRRSSLLSRPRKLLRRAYPALPEQYFNHLTFPRHLLLCRCCCRQSSSSSIRVFRLSKVL